jgi:HSP20 family protein
MRECTFTVRVDLNVVSSMTQFAFLPSGESADLADDIRDLFEDLASRLRHEHRAYSGEYRPALDVYESDVAIEVVMDVAGVPADALRVLFRGDVLIIAGEKAPPATDQSQAYHLVERDFGRFARSVRLKGAFDLDKTRATLRQGELWIVLPKIPDRRGKPQMIRVEEASGGGA